MSIHRSMHVGYEKGASGTAEMMLKAQSRASLLPTPLRPPTPSLYTPSHRTVWSAQSDTQPFRTSWQKRKRGIAMTKLASRRLPSTPSLSQNQALPIISADFQMRFFLTSLVSYHLQTPGTALSQREEHQHPQPAIIFHFP